MTLQYRSDTDRLLYIESGADVGDLANECCCEECADAVACHRFESCCDDEIAFDDLPDHPHYIVIGDARYTTLGDPSCVVYDDCCYCTHTTTDKPINVTETEVTASSEANCADCYDTDGDDCEFCVPCNDCDPMMQRTFTITFNADFKSGTFSTPEIQAAAQALLDTPWEVSFDNDPLSYDCYWIHDVSGDPFVYLRWDLFNRWICWIAMPEGKNVGAAQPVPALADPCDPTSPVMLTPDDSYLEAGGTAVAS